VRKIVVHAHAYEAPPPTKANALRIAEPEVMELAHDNVWVVIGVEDSGKGLSMDELGKLFARFSQANPKSDMYGGSGLGLYVSKKLIELHSGFIEVESLPGHVRPSLPSLCQY
jgi:signal transduction histidine kinase